ncbi:hypothetical protein ACFO9Q_01040 [Paenibacillus sp. GCM10023252]|uniref:hypothetical protein n=1 Tax=Paenibacillus sp. GCM10023252 TaxID=3252649 RepID=UPI003622D27E
MTFKAIDLQVSVPRSQDSGAMQSHSQHRITAEQTTMNAQSLKKTEELRSKSTGVEQSPGLQIRSQADQGQGEGQSSRRSKPDKQDSSSEASSDGSEPSHPYKGHIIDISL